MNEQTGNHDGKSVHMYPFRMQPKKRGKRRILRILAVCIAILGIWAGYLLWKIERTIEEAVPRKADVAIVLGAAVWGERPSPGLRERLDQALELYRQGYVPYLLVTGGLGEGKTSTEASVMRNYLVEQGVPEDRIFMEHQARDTYENLLFSKEIMQQHGLSQALVVSHDYHLARAVDMAETIDLDASPVGVTSHVLYSPYYKAREVLALTKWHLSHPF
ncbi:YdcF family protein [Brevibacillus borstelensis]|uniref:YdcF family protein n=1 Tax=Brevibacillus borstelensis TaxID=45462 RepID=UPI0030BF612B